MSLDTRRDIEFSRGDPYFYVYFSKDTCDTAHIVHEAYIRDTGWHKEQFSFEAKDNWDHLSIRCRHMYKDTTTDKGRDYVWMYLDNLSAVIPDTAYNSLHFPITSTCKGMGIYVLRSPYAGAAQYWYDGAALLGSGDSIEVSPVRSTVYTLLLGKDSCIASVLQTTVVPDCGGAQLVFPNAFTPDANGRNDLFRVMQHANLYQLRDYELSVYNRWGQRIYRTEAYSQGWDGADAGMGVYFWLCRYTLADGSRHTQKGEVTLIR